MMFIFSKNLSLSCSFKLWGLSGHYGRVISTSSPYNGMLDKLWGRGKKKEKEGGGGIEDEDDYSQELKLLESTLLEQEVEKQREKLRRDRNKSKLSASDRLILSGNAPLKGLTHIYDSNHRSKEHQMSMLGKYGAEATKIDPSVSWPTPQQLQDQEEFEKVFYDGKNLKELMEELETEKRDKIKNAVEREAEIETNLVSMEKQLKMWRDRVIQRNKQAEIEKKKEGRMLQELKEEFGYEIDPSLPQFKKAIENKEAEIAKRDKDERKKIRNEKLKAMAEKEALKAKEQEQQSQSTGTS